MPAFTIVIALLQSTLRRAYDGDANTAFFLLHSLVNAAITALVWPELCTTLGAPIYSLRRPVTTLSPPPPLRAWLVDADAVLHPPPPSLTNGGR